MILSDEFIQSRRRKAEKIEAILQDYLGKVFQAQRILDVGCREGTILASLTARFPLNIGIDTDHDAIQTGREMYKLPKFLVGDGEQMPFPKGCFDIIICAQVYEHSQDVNLLIADIYRTLKPGGAVFFSGPNRLALMEGHYHLPLLSWLPGWLANLYVRLFRGIPQYDAKPLFPWQLRRLLREFKIIDYTPKLLQRPERYALAGRVRLNSIPGWLAHWLRPLVPNFNWILIKPDETIGIPHIAYTHDYYADECDGHREFSLSKGTRIPERLSLPLEIANIQPGQYMLDIGCGRGELTSRCQQKGAFTWGLDYAPAALNIAKAFKSQNLAFQRAEAQKLPFGEHSFDTVFMLDIVEHLHPLELQTAFGEVWRVLKPGGTLIIHTMPNLWYYRFGYPIFRVMQRIRGKNLPQNPRARWKYAHLHINEQTPRTLRKSLRASHFNTQVWLENVQKFEQEKNPIARAIMRALTGWLPFKLIFCNDILAVAAKK